jgi:hypothetical protein
MIEMEKERNELMTHMVLFWELGKRAVRSMFTWYIRHLVNISTMPSVMYLPCLVITHLLQVHTSWTLRLAQFLLPFLYMRYPPVPSKITPTQPPQHPPKRFRQATSNSSRQPEADRIPQDQSFLHQPGVLDSLHQSSAITITSTDSLHRDPAPPHLFPPTYLSVAMDGRFLGYGQGQDVGRGPSQESRSQHGKCLSSFPDPPAAPQLTIAAKKQRHVRFADHNKSMPLDRHDTVKHPAHPASTRVDTAAPSDLTPESCSLAMTGIEMTGELAQRFIDHATFGFAGVGGRMVANRAKSLVRSVKRVVTGSAPEEPVKEAVDEGWYNGGEDISDGWEDLEDTPGADGTVLSDQKGAKRTSA